MNLSCLLCLLEGVPGYGQLVEQLSTAEGEHRAIILDAAKPYLIASLYEELNLPMLVITAQPESAKKLYEQLQVWCSPSANLHLFPEIDFLPYEYFASHSSNTVMERLQVLATLAFSGPFASCHSEGALRCPCHSDTDPFAFCHSERSEESREPSPSLYSEFGMTAKPSLIVASVLAVINKTIPRGDFISACHILKPGMWVDPLNLLHRWQSIGYEIEDMVEVPGQVSKRGGIIDVFPPCSQSPVRLDFFGNQVESMRLFDPESQCSAEPISALLVTPAKEVVIPSSKFKVQSSLNLDNCTTEVKQRFEEDIFKLQQYQWFTHTQFYFPLFNAGNIFDYLYDSAFLILDLPSEIKDAIGRLDKQAQESRKGKLEHGELPEGFPFPYLTWDELESKVKTGQRLMLESWDATEDCRQALPFALPQSYGGKLEIFLKATKEMMAERQRVFVVSHQANRLAELLQEQDIHTYPISQIEQVPPRGSITVIQGSLSEGWKMSGELNLITDAELFGFVKQRRPGKKAPVRRQWLLPQLSPGDYVVHIDHGIGRFNGLTKMSTDGSEREYLVLEYAAGDKLYVPTDQIERVNRYIGGSDHPPILSRLGTQEWERTKRRVKESVADIAQELLDLYAAREVTLGLAFSSDTLWQQELEASFPYEETPDQLEAIAAVKEDMEKAKPLDRLICGDVGYGKTEVALRAAFKAVVDDKQVAILVPTTVLAQQHFTTFRERLQAFPIRVEMLSRFCSKDTEREILEGLANGTVDICIGTHRLLQKDVTFKDIGLVVIDEEQQFGVVQKERLKQMRREVDVLTLSATPIPRTLHMSLTGVRDMSIMGTPPEERLSIKTYVGDYDDNLVRQAILRELERNGQVFFVHNRVQSIALVASKLQTLVPEARITIAHGQMPEEELEKVVTEFIEGNYDVLVTTTIIQLGMDMPNVNTLIVDQADKFGLTQLYQLRGRVGRGINQAYAYFLFDKGKQLTPQAHKRLRTIFEATELGAGFGIAMKDLEIRGAGNLLGVKQSGHIAALGFDLYCQMLAEAVEELKARQAGVIRKREAEFSPSIALPLTAYIPEEYVSNLNARLNLYNRLAKVERTEEVGEIAQELKDRFGALPEPVKNLLYIVEIKLLAAKVGVESIYTQGKQVVLNLAQGKRMINLASYEYKDAIKVGTKQVRLDTNKRLGNKWQEKLRELLSSQPCNDALGRTPK